MARAAQNHTHWELRHFLLRIRHQLLRLDLIVLCVILVVLVRMTVKAPLKRPLALLGILLAGASSFLLVLPATFLAHHWMMYRHFLLFSVLLLALVVDGTFRLFQRIRVSLARRTNHKEMVIALSLTILSLLPLAWTAWRNGRDIQAELAWQNARLTSFDPSNLVSRFLDVVYWTDGGPIPYDDHIFLTVDGERSNPISERHPEFAISSKGTTHHEIWWLEPVNISKISILTEHESAESFINSCSLSWFDGAAFQNPLTEPVAEIEPFRPNRSEPPAPSRSWVHLRSALHTRSLRVACAKLPHDTPVFEVEVR